VNAGEFRYVWDVVRTDIVRAWDDRVACSHREWGVYEPPPYCHECMEPGLRRLVEEGARDDEILPAFAQAPIPDRRWMEATLLRLRSEGPGPAATDKRRPRSIPDVPRAYDAAIRALHSRQTRLTWPNVATEIATTLGITLTEGTLRRWCDEEHLPDPTERWRLIGG
jgi:hypothetical protein